MRRVPFLFSAILLASQALPALSQAQTPATDAPVKDAFVYYNYGVMHYMAKDYAAAAKSLEQAVNHGMSKSPAARYVLGNTYFLTDQRDQAVGQYNNAAVMDPTGQAGIYSKYCLNWIKADNARKAVENQKQPPVKVDDADTKASLPSLPSIEMERPSIYEITQWSDNVRAGYFGQSQTKIQTDSYKLQAARDLYRQAQAICNAMVPTQPNRDESGPAFARRRQAYVDRAQQLLKPYQDYAISCQENMKDAVKISDACRAAYKRLNNENPTTAWNNR